jgi:hypothetical protein
MAREFTEERLRIGLEGIQGLTMVVMGHPSAQNPKQVIQGLQLWRVGREEDQPQPWAMSSQQRGDLSRLFGTVEPGIVDENNGLPPSGPRSRDESIAQGAERETIPAVSVQADRRAAAPIHGGKEVPFAIGSRGRDLPLPPPSRPATGQGGQQGQLRFVLDVQIYPRRRAHFERLGAGPFDA